MAEGLTFNDVIILHKKLSEKGELENLLEKQNKLEECSFDDGISLAQDLYINLMAKHRGINLFEIFKKQVEDLGVIERIKKDLLEKSPLLKENNLEMTPELVMKAVAKAIAIDKVGDKICVNIRTIRDQNTLFKAELVKIYNAKRDLFFRSIAIDILEKKPSSQIVESNEKPTQSSSMFSGLFSSSKKIEPPKIELCEVKILTTEQIQKQINEDEKEFKFFKGDEDIWGECQLAEKIKKMKFTKLLGSLDENDFVIIHQGIMEDKINELKDNHDKNFMASYKKEIAQKAKTLYKGMLFYRLTSVMDSIRNDNKEFLMKLFSQEEK